MFSFQTIKEVCESIVKDDSWVNDSHTAAQHKGMYEAINLLLGELQSLDREPPKIEIFITESDLADFTSIVYGDENMKWVESIPYMGNVEVEFINQDEYKQREA